MKITWRGHACFVLTSDQGVRVATDPYDASVGYPMRAFSADAVLMSHGHHDHCCRDLLRGEPVIIQTPGTHDACGVRVTGFESWHDDRQGALRGPNILYLIEMDGVRILHAGDLGEAISADTLARIGHVDVLMIPVGGTYTLTGPQAAEIARALGAAVTIPMHYKASCVTYPLTDERPFLTAMHAADAPRCAELEVTQRNVQTLPRVVVMDWEE